jgi:peptidyl-prolyl cis-trans isomerase A (cyclophilin A)
MKTVIDSCKTAGPRVPMNRRQRLFRMIPVAMLIALTLVSCSETKQAVVKASADQKAPAVYRVDFDTSRGPFVVEVTRELAPNGADHFYSLVKAKYFDGARFYRVVPGFMVQFGSAADPKVSAAWDKSIPDDPVKISNVRGTVSFAATSQPDSRSTHIFINFGDNGRLDGMGFAPFGKVVSGMENVDQIYSGDGERPDQEQMKAEGNAYLQREFPNLDYIKTARIEQ